MSNAFHHFSSYFSKSNQLSQSQPQQSASVVAARRQLSVPSAGAARDVQSPEWHALFISADLLLAGVLMSDASLVLRTHKVDDNDTEMVVSGALFGTLAMKKLQDKDIGEIVSVPSAGAARD